MTVDEIKTLLDIARSSGCKDITIDGVKYTLGQDGAITAPQTPLNDVKAEDLIKPLSTFDEINDEDVLYWSTPYYDQLQAQRAEMAKKKKEGMNG